jgi:arylsulfatase A-like enzyme
MRIIILSVLLVLSGRAADKPNIVFILADDLGINDLGNEGSAFHETPHIDRIAGMGMKFTRGYATCQVCSPSRASILTGKYPVNHGITTWIGDAAGKDWSKRKRHDSHLPAAYDRELRKSEHTLAEVLYDAGYKTFFAGKWHLGDTGSHPTDHGFEINKGGWRVGGPGKGGYFSPYMNPKLEDGPAGESLPIRLGEETADFIRANADKPFLAYLSFYAVHGPIQTSKELWHKYREKAVKAGLAKTRFRFDRRLGVRQVQDCPVYAGLVEQMDDGIGRVLAALDEKGLTDTTIICFTSDNGGVSSGDNYSTSCLPLRGGKGRQWEGGIREPFYLYAPGVTKPSSITATPANGIDWYPTLLALAGVPSPAGQKVDGVSLVPVLKGGSIPDRPLYWHYPHYGNQGGEPSSILMEDQWKLIYYHEDGRHELYNIAADIGEESDIIAAHPERAKAMQKRLADYLASVPAKFPAKDTEFDSAKREARWSDLKTKGVKRLESSHANYLKPEYKPNANWWESETKD